MMNPFHAAASPAPRGPVRGFTMRGFMMGLLALLAGAASAFAAPEDVDALLHSLIGKDEATIEQKFGVPDRIESNGVQDFLLYYNFDFWRTSPKPYPFGYSQGFSGALGLRGRAAFDCTTTLVFRDGLLRAYARQGSGCRSMSGGRSRSG